MQAQILAINSDPSLSRVEKNRRIQGLYRNRFSTNVPTSSAMMVVGERTDGCTIRTYRKPGVFGCSHYQRNCRIKAECCNTFYTCRLCHDEKSSHKIDRYATKTMVCMHCLTVQDIAEVCSNTTCGKQMAKYFCGKCRLFDGDYTGHIFHCDDCGLCRKADHDKFFHCHKCNTCLSTSQEEHVCIERSLESDCPVCGEWLFTSMRPISFPPCYHPIHEDCMQAYTKFNYTCPTCVRSLYDASALFRRIDEQVARDEMPAEFQDHVSEVLCNDCLRKSTCKYHFLYHKCSHCKSYNTRILRSGAGPLPPLEGSSSTTAPSDPSPSAPSPLSLTQLSFPTATRPPPSSSPSPPNDVNLNSDSEMSVDSSSSNPAREVASSLSSSSMLDDDSIDSFPSQIDAEADARAVETLLAARVSPSHSQMIEI